VKHLTALVRLVFEADLHKRSRLTEFAVLRRALRSAKITLPNYFIQKRSVRVDVQLGWTLSRGLLKRTTLQESRRSCTCYRLSFNTNEKKFGWTSYSHQKMRGRGQRYEGRRLVRVSFFLLSDLSGVALGVDGLPVFVRRSRTVL
jgi:hypothetical protein